MTCDGVIPSPQPWARALPQALSLVRHSRRLPPSVVVFRLRALRRAKALGDQFSLFANLRAPALQALLDLARHRRRVVEIGSGSGWTAVALALGDARCEVRSYDRGVHPYRDFYLDLVSAGVRDRLEFVTRFGQHGPERALEVDLLFIDSSHRREETIATYRAWSGSVVPGGLVVFDDFENPYFPGVAEAIGELGLTGERRGQLFVVS